MDDIKITYKKGTYFWLSYGGGERLVKYAGMAKAFSGEITYALVKEVGYPFTRWAMTLSEFYENVRVASDEEVGIHFAQNDPS